MDTQVRRRSTIKNTARRHRLALPALVDLYLLRCEVEGKSPNTIRAYGETLGRFLRVAEDEGFPLEPARLEPHHLYAYLGRFNHHSFETRHRYFREVRCFFNWLVQAGYLAESPFRSLKNVRLPQRIVRPFSTDDITQLLACCDAKTAVGARDQAILFALLDTGIRCSELVQLNLDDLDLDAGRLRVLHGKGNKQRTVSFAARCQKTLRRYLKFRDDDAGPLFLAASHLHALKPGVALRPNGLKQMLRRLGRQSGLPRVHAHRFRHTFATWAIEQDARELDVQFLLGHSSPDMVRRYASTYNSEQAARRHVTFSPAERLALATTSASVGSRRVANVAKGRLKIGLGAPAEQAGRPRNHRRGTDVAPKILNLRADQLAAPVDLRFP